jgi:hypothetical protein
MLYSIQNAYGQVYGIFPMPDSNQSSEVWAAELGAELGDILGINGVRDTPLASSASGEKQDRIVIDIEPSKDEEKVARIHETVARLALKHSPNA